jgi:hypothetical protein
MSAVDPALEDDRTPKEAVRRIVEKVGRDMKNNDERITADRLVGRAICRAKAGNYSESLYLDAATEYVEHRVRTDTKGLDVDRDADKGRDVCKPPEARRHGDYQKPHWATAHIEDVDRFGAIADDIDDRVRIDLDGVGSGGASTHDTGENLNLSIWITPNQAEDLIGDLEGAFREVWA